MANDSKMSPELQKQLEKLMEENKDLLRRLAEEEHREDAPGNGQRESGHGKE